MRFDFCVSSVGNNSEDEASHCHDNNKNNNHDDSASESCVLAKGSVPLSDSHESIDNTSSNNNTNHSNDDSNDEEDRDYIPYDYDDEIERSSDYVCNEIHFEYEGNNNNNNNSSPTTNGDNGVNDFDCIYSPPLFPNKEGGGTFTFRANSNSHSSSSNNNNNNNNTNAQFSLDDPSPYDSVPRHRSSTYNNTSSTNSNNNLEPYSPEWLRDQQRRYNSEKRAESSLQRHRRHHDDRIHPEVKDYHYYSARMLLNEACRQDYAHNYISSDNNNNNNTSSESWAERREEWAELASFFDTINKKSDFDECSQSDSDDERNLQSNMESSFLFPYCTNGSSSSSKKKTFHANSNSNTSIISKILSSNKKDCYMMNGDVCFRYFQVLNLFCYASDSSSNNLKNYRNTDYFDNLRKERKMREEAAIFSYYENLHKESEAVARAEPASTSAEEEGEVLAVAPAAAATAIVPTDGDASEHDEEPLITMVLDVDSLSEELLTNMSNTTNTPPQCKTPNPQDDNTGKHSSSRNSFISCSSPANVSPIVLNASHRCISPQLSDSFNTYIHNYNNAANSNKGKEIVVPLFDLPRNSLVVNFSMSTPFGCADNDNNYVDDDDDDCITNGVDWNEDGNHIFLNSLIK